MRIALCMSSMIRLFEPCWSSVAENVLKPLGNHELDFYGHFPPTELDVLARVQEDVKGQCRVLIEKDPAAFPPAWLEMTEKMRVHGNGIRGTLLQWHSMKQVVDLVVGSYDLMIWMRPDLRVEVSIEEDPPTDAIYLPNHDDWQGLHDRFSYGPPAMIRQRADILRYFVDDWYDQDSLAQRHKKWRWNPERVLQGLCLHHELPVRRTRVRVSRVRANGEVIPAGRPPPRRRRRRKLKRSSK